MAEQDIVELLEWLRNPQYTNGVLDFEAVNHMRQAADLITSLRSAGGTGAAKCFECETPIVGPLCPRCNPTLAGGTADGWRPISSAPNMKTVLLFAVTDVEPETGRVRNWKMATGWWTAGYADDPVFAPWHWDGRVIGKHELQPTHWMPLPAAPGAASPSPAPSSTAPKGEDELRKALAKIVLLDEAGGHELTVNAAFHAVGIAHQALSAAGYDPHDFQAMLRLAEHPAACASSLSREG